MRVCALEAVAKAGDGGGNGGDGGACEVGCGVYGFGTGAAHKVGPGNPVPSVMVDASVWACFGVCVAVGDEVMWVCIVACIVKMVGVCVVLSRVIVTLARLRIPKRPSPIDPNLVH